MKVRRYIHKDMPRLLDLVRIVHDERVYEKAVQRFQWQYEKNPANTPESPLIFILEDENRVIGMIGAFAQRIKIGNTIYPAYWVGDYMVHPDFRQSFNAIKLAKKISVHPHLMMGFPAENTVKLWFRAKAIQFSQLVEYSKNMHYIDHLTGSLFQNPFKEIQIFEVQKFDESFDRLWVKVSQNYQVIQVRDSRFLNWRFIQCPHMKYRIFVAVKNNETQGFIVIRNEIRNKAQEGHIVDLFAQRSDSMTVNSLMQAGMHALRLAGCKVIKMVVSSDDKVSTDLLAQYSFSLSANKERGILFNNTGKDINPVLETPGNWFLTNADSDLDFS